MIRVSVSLATALIALTPFAAHSQQIPAIQGAQYNGPLPGESSAGSIGAANMPTEQEAAAAQAAAEVPRTMPPAIPALSPNKPLNGKQKAAVKAANKWKAKSAIPSVSEDGTVLFMYGAGEPTIVCAPLNVCNLKLDDGEILTGPPNIGDPRFNIEFAMIGNGRTAATNIIIKPQDAGLNTNILLHTSKKRIYSINLSSHSRDSMPKVAFTYPQQTTDNSWQKYAAQVSNINTNAAAEAAPASVCDQVPAIPSSAFSINGDGVPWKPVQVYAVSTDVGNKMCIQFPAEIGSIRLPAIAALEKDGGWFSGPTTQMVDAHFENGRYVVDEMVNRLVLFRGVGSSQETVTVERKK